MPDEDATPTLEETAEELYEDAPCGYLTTRPDGRILRVNRTFERWTGHAREDLLDGRRFQDLLTRAGRVYHETHVAPLLRMQDAVMEIALEVECVDGQRLPVLVNSTLKRDQAGEPLLVRTTIFNATDRHAYERELLAARRAERAARERVERLQRVTSAVVSAVDAPAIAHVLLDEVERALTPAGAAFAVAAGPGRAAGARDPRGGRAAGPDGARDGARRRWRTRRRASRCSGCSRPAASSGRCGSCPPRARGSTPTSGRCWTPPPSSAPCRSIARACTSTIAPWRTSCSAACSPAGPRATPAARSPRTTRPACARWRLAGTGTTAS